MVRRGEPVCSSCCSSFGIALAFFRGIFSPDSLEIRIYDVGGGGRM
jgi:hypothetical protein